MTDKEKIIHFLDFKGISKNKFYVQTGLSVGFLDSGSSLGVDKLRIIIDNYPDLSMEWMISGTGEMIIEKSSMVQEPKLKYGKKGNEGIPLYDLTATAGAVSVFSNSKESIPIDYIKIPNLPKCDGAIHITGDSMYPLLKSGDVVLYKQLHDKQNIIWGEMYIMYINNNNDEFFFVKYVQQSNREGYVKLVSQNQHHHPVEFPIDSIKQIAIVKASIRINSQI